MLIDIINRDAEKKLLFMLERITDQNSGSALHFRFSELGTRPNEDNFLITVWPALENKSAALYFFENGDVVITWKGMRKATLDDLCHRLYERYAPETEGTLHAYFDLRAQEEDLRQLCKRNMPVIVAVEKKPAVEKEKEKSTSSLKFMDKLTSTFPAALRQRKNRLHPEILVVEDQAFSRTLLIGMLSQTYKTYSSIDAAQAMDLYCTHAPDLVFMDIELPDMDGHDLAAAIRGLDPQAYIVMVTGNNHAQDVLRAKENSVKGFIVKPYNKQKIQASIDKFMQERSK